MNLPCSSHPRALSIFGTMCAIPAALIDVIGDRLPCMAFLLGNISTPPLFSAPIMLSAYRLNYVIVRQQNLLKADSGEHARTFEEDEAISRAQRARALYSTSTTFRWVLIMYLPFLILAGVQMGVKNDSYGDPHVGGCITNVWAVSINFVFVFFACMFCTWLFLQLKEKKENFGIKWRLVHLVNYGGPFTLVWVVLDFEGHVTKTVFLHHHFVSFIFIIWYLHWFIIPGIQIMRRKRRGFIDFSEIDMEEAVSGLRKVMRKISQDSNDHTGAAKPPEGPSEQSPSLREQETPPDSPKRRPSSPETPRKGSGALATSASVPVLSPPTSPRKNAAPVASAPAPTPSLSRSPSNMDLREELPFSLSEFLNTTEGYECFRLHLTHELAVENLLFWKAVELFRLAPSMSDAISIFQTYIPENAPMPVNISAKTRFLCRSVASKYGFLGTQRKNVFQSNAALARRLQDRTSRGSSQQGSPAAEMKKLQETVAGKHSPSSEPAAGGPPELQRLQQQQQQQQQQKAGPAETPSFAVSVTSIGKLSKDAPEAAGTSDRTEPVVMMSVSQASQASPEVPLDIVMMFDKAQKEVFRLMETDSLRRFFDSEMYREFLKRAQTVAEQIHAEERRLSRGFSLGNLFGRRMSAATSTRELLTISPVSSPGPVSLVISPSDSPVPSSPARGVPNSPRAHA
eukprot:TRINITY_DN1495_c0_g1_i3.p1 TRINITY_DN1495_c0_g1~~TRINITY_DN1495_c0_g1_i3.p1  ORF type:complete len:684 (+),score=129.72 TRINITY_DN1495_c0_g1_i3:49-2100(+)